MSTNGARFLFGGALLCVLLQFSSGYHKCGDIKDSDLTVVDPEWYHESMEKGFYMNEQGNWNHCRDKASWFWTRLIGRGRSSSAVKKICYIWDSVVSSGKVDVPMKCSYTRLENQECEVDFGGTSAHGDVEMSGSVKFLKTDNKTYIAGTYCLFGKKASYWIFSTTEAQLDPEILKDLGRHFTKIGFNNGQTSAKKGISPLFLNKLISVNC